MNSVDQNNTITHITKIIYDFWATSSTNSLHLDNDEKAWLEPHIAIAAGDDPLFLTIKQQIGPFHWTPEEAFALAWPNTPVSAADLRVISYVLPQTAQTRKDQQQEKEFPAKRWAKSRFHGEEFNCALRSHLAKTLTASGFPALAPERLPAFDTRKSKNFGLASNWSERHVAFIAGHGTFGLSDGLITRWGKAVRFGSVVVKANLPCSIRPYNDNHHAWCLWYAKGKCGACVSRCPAAAIATDTGHNKSACFSYIREFAAPYATKTYATGATPCGLCQVRIPCEAQVPPVLLEQEPK